jgi:hypothetical protein
LMYFLTYFCQNSGCGTTLPTLLFHSVLLLLQTTQGQEKSRRAVVCSPVWCYSTFQSVSVPGLCRVQGGGRFSVGCALRLFVSVLKTPNRFGQISET